MAKYRSIETLSLDGGTLCFNFINTVYAWHGENLHEYINDYDDFIKWSSKLKLLPKKILIQLQKLVEEDEKAGTQVMNKIWNTREALYNFFSAVAAKKYDKIKDLLPSFNKLLSQGTAGIGFIVKGKEILLTHTGHNTDVLQPLWIVLRSAFDMLTLEDINRIKECPECGWIFLDRTKNGKRRWCNPTDCGSTDKMKRYYLRKKKK